MFFRRYYLACLSHASFMIADESTKVAMVVDPQRDVQQYLDDANDHGFDLRYVVLTHFHADFVAGHIELRDSVGAKICMGQAAKAEFDFRRLRDDDVLSLGELPIRILETPGHTPEGITLVIEDAEGDDIALTGDTLFVGDVGRPDLLASDGYSSEELAAMLFESLHQKLLKLPDATRIYPCHGAGSMCGKDLGDDAFSTIGRQREQNYALQPMSRDEFIRLVTEDLGTPPEYFSHDAELNQSERMGLTQSLRTATKPLGIEAVQDAMRAGAQLLDTRDAVSFAAAHLPNAIHIGIDGRFAMWAGSMLDPDRPIVVVADPQRTDEVLLRLGRVGLDRVEGYLDGGMDALRDADVVLNSSRRITATQLIQNLDDYCVVDVRSPTEWRKRHLRDSVNLPLHELRRSIDQLSKDQLTAVHCEGGYRSSIAASYLRSQGFRNVVDLVGGIRSVEVTDPSLMVQSASTSADDQSLQDPTESAECKLANNPR